MGNGLFFSSYFSLSLLVIKNLRTGGKIKTVKPGARSHKHEFRYLSKSFDFSDVEHVFFRRFSTSLETSCTPLSVQCLEGKKIFSSEMLCCVFTITLSRKTVCPLCMCMENTSAHEELLLGKQYSSSESCSSLTLHQHTYPVLEAAGWQKCLLRSHFVIKKVVFVSHFK